MKKTFILLMKFIIIITAITLNFYCSGNNDEKTNDSFKYYRDSFIEKKNGSVVQSGTYVGTCIGKSYFEILPSNEVNAVSFSDCETTNSTKGTINSQRTKITIDGQSYDIKFEPNTLTFFRIYSVLGTSYESYTIYKTRQ